MSESTLPVPVTVRRTAVRIPLAGLCLTYRLITDGDRRRVEILAEDGRGKRCESVGGFPSDAAAERFFYRALDAAVTPYTLVALYDDWLASEL